MDLLAGAVDAVDLLCYTHADPPEGLDAYVHMLNAGFPIAPSAGTDAGLASGASYPPGGYRVYVEVDGALTLDGWIDGLVNGQSFVSNYPLITEFAVEGSGSGDVLAHGGQLLNGTISVECVLPISTVEIIANTGVLQTLTPGGGSATSFTSGFQFDPTGLTWVVARVLGTADSWHVLSASGLFAQTAPVYLSPPSLPPAPQWEKDAAAYFLEQLLLVQFVYDTDGYFPGDSRDDYDEAMTESVMFFAGLHSGLPSDVRPPTPDGAWEITSTWPNPFNPDLVVRYRAGHEHHRVDVYNVEGRHMRTLFDGQQDPGEHMVTWDGRNSDGAAATSGVYFIRLSTSHSSTVRKVVLLK